MKIYKIARKGETWVDSTGKVVYIKGVSCESPRLTWVEFREARDMQSGSVTKTLEDGSKVTFFAPFMLQDDDNGIG